MARLTPELHQIIRWLRKYHPVVHPTLVVLSAKMDGDYLGLTELRHEKVLMIRLRPTLPAIELRETLLHEWAHCLSWLDQNIAKSQVDHDSVFSAAYQGLIEHFEEDFPWLSLRAHRV